jgi:hypothetical protein
MKRIMPFYSFQRFAIPLIARATKNTPGRVANAGKAAKTMMEVYGKIHGGGELTPAEQSVLPGWIIQQPYEHAGWDDEMNARFKTFNNYSPLDVMNFTEFNEATGKPDWAKSIQKAALSQLTPLIKIPLELAVNKSFFTDRELRGERGEQQLGDVDMDVVLGMLFGQVVAGGGKIAGGTGGGLLTIAAGGLLGQALSKLPVSVGKETLGRLMGMQEYTDPRTGKRKVMVNAYAVHVLTGMAPALQEAFKFGREDKTPLEKAEKLLWGIPTYKQNLQEEVQWRKKEKGEHTAMLKRKARRAKTRGLENAYFDARSELELWQEDMLNDNETLLRGGGIRGPNPDFSP